MLVTILVSLLRITDDEEIVCFKSFIFNSCGWKMLAYKKTGKAGAKTTKCTKSNNATNVIQQSKFSCSLKAQLYLILLLPFIIWTLLVCPTSQS